MTGLTVLLVSFNDVADPVGQRADFKNAPGCLIICGVWLDGPDIWAVLPILLPWRIFQCQLGGFGFVRPWPAVEIVQEPHPCRSSVIGARLASLVIRGFAKPLGELIAQPSDGEGRQILGSSARINSDDVVLLSDCRQAVIFSATRTRHSSGTVRFSWAAGEGALDNRATEQLAGSLLDESEWLVTPADFEAGSRLLGPIGRRFYVAESLTSTPERRVFALWQKPVFGNALE